MASVHDGAEVRARARQSGDGEHGFGNERLEIRDARVVAACGGRDSLDLGTMIEGKDAEVALKALHGCGAMQCRDALVLVRPCGRRGAPHEIIELGACRHGRRTAMAGDDDRACGIAATAAMCGRQVLDPAAEVAGKESVARAEDIQDFHRESRDDETLVDARGDWSFEDHAAVDAALHDDRRPRALADRLQRFERACAAAGDANLLFGADDEVAIRQESLELPRHFGRAPGAIGAFAMTGNPPQHGAVVDVEHDTQAVFLRKRDRAPRGLANRFGREVCPGDRERLCGCERRGVDISGLESHVGAILAVENVREAFRALDA